MPCGCPPSKAPLAWTSPSSAPALSPGLWAVPHQRSAVGIQGFSDGATYALGLGGLPHRANIIFSALLKHGQTRTLLQVSNDPCWVQAW